MGNCTTKGIAGECNTVRVLNDSGHLIEFKGPKLVDDLLLEYPDHAIFRHGRVSSPLANSEYLVGGQCYNLLPVDQKHVLHPVSWSSDFASSDFVREKQEHECDHQVPGVQVLPSLGDGIWRVKMVIKREQLGEILAGEVNTEALIESMRMAAASSSMFEPRKRRSSWGAARKLVLPSVFNVSAGDASGC